MALLLLATGSAFAQTSNVVGTVVQSGTAVPLEGASIQLEGTNFGAVTQANGRFIILNVPAGTYSLRAEMIGHAPVTQSITVTQGQATVVNLSLQVSAIALQEVVVTGTIGATQKVKLPFTVDQLNVADMPVPALSAASSIQGKVAGAMVVQGSGRPGSAPSVLLRGVTSLDASGRSQEPLYIVDGVILGSTMIDIDALDIQSIEVVKGAAAASLYGSRAANGVVQITTKRGRTAPNNDVRYTVRSQYGQSWLPSPKVLLTKSHHYRMNDAKTMFVSRTGVECDWLQCPTMGGVAANGANSWSQFQVNPWPGGARDQVQEFFRGGVSNENYVAASGRSGNTNFHVSFSNLLEEGVMPGQEGFERNNFRVNVDQSIRENVELSASAFYSRSTSDLFPESQGNPLFHLTRMPGGVDLTACQDDPARSCFDDPDNMILLPDPTNTESPNPLYTMLTRNYTEKRGRFLGSANLRFTPMEWLTLDASASYDRLEEAERDLYPKGYRTVNASSLNNGYMDQRDELVQAVNASATATMRFDLAENVRNTTQFRYLYEQADNDWNFTSGYRFSVKDVPSFGNLDPTRLGASSEIESVRADGYFGNTEFDILDRYGISALLRNDGSSLFGPEERRHWYYRIGGYWRLAEESWFSLPAVDELKIRYSIGTAGSRPRFAAQYETYSVSGGQVVPVTLGNRALKPEHTREQEAGLDALFLNGRLGITVTYAQNATDDQILRVPLPAYTGYSEQWRNAGTIESKTWEASLDARLVQTQDLSWSVRLLYDRTRSEIARLNNVPDFVYGVPGQAMGSVFYARAGEQVGTFYGTHFATSCSDLPATVSDRCGEFAVNNDGYLVWVGNGSLSDNAWGTSSGMIIGGRPVFWGAPVKGYCTDRSTGLETDFCKLGKTLPDYSVSLGSTLAWKGFTLYGLLNAVQGFDVYNQPLQWAIFKNYGGTMDQSGVPEAEQKPIAYYGEIYGVSGLQPSSAFVEDGSFLKLREVSLRYNFDRGLLSSVPGLSTFDGIALSLIGRNLYTWTDYRGYDPEVGKSGGTTGSSAIARVEGYQYPNFRTWTLGVELNF